MASLSGFSRCEVGSIASAEQSFVDEILPRANTMEPSRLELSERIAALELENERLRIEVESSKIETDATNASNRGLKNKIAELFVEAQIGFQERQRLESALKDAGVRLSAAENSCKWYESKLHECRAKEKSHREEIEAYEEILKRRQKNLVDLTTRCEELDAKCVELASRHKKEKRALSCKLETLRSRQEACKSCLLGGEHDATEDASSDLLRYKLEEMEKFTRESANRLRASEQRLANSETSRNSLETVSSEYRRLLAEAEENMRKLESEKREIGGKLEESRLESRKIRDDNEKLQIFVLSSKRERIQVEEAIVHLRSQLDRMIDRYKSLKTTNVESQHKLSAMQELQSENKHLKLLLYATNNSLFKKLTEEKHRVVDLVNRLQEEKSRVFMNDEEWQDLEARSKSKVLDESIDEGYGDGSIVSTASTEVSSSHSDSELIKSAVNVLSRSKNFMAPLEETVEQLRSRLQKLGDIGKE